MRCGDILGSLTHAIDMPRFPVGQLNRRRKEAREDIINSNRSLTALRKEASHVKQEVNDTKRILRALRERKRRLNEKVSRVHK